jgi:hypothetical protein
MATDWAKFAAIKVVKILGIILVALFAIIVFAGIFTNKPIKVWVIEFNRRDTAFKYITTTVYDTPPTVILHDTLYITAPTHSNKHTVTQSNKNGDNNTAGRDNRGVQGGTNNKNHIVSGDHDTVGVNGDVNNYNGIKQRTLSADQIRYIISYISGPNTQVVILYPNNDKESINLANQVEEYLNNNGYKYVHSKPNPDPVTRCFDSIRCEKMANANGEVVVFICPQSNVSS